MDGNNNDFGNIGNVTVCCFLFSSCFNYFLLCSFISTIASLFSKGLFFFLFVHFLHIVEYWKKKLKKYGMDFSLLHHLRDPIRCINRAEASSQSSGTLKSIVNKDPYLLPWPCVRLTHRNTFLITNWIIMYGDR